MSESAEYTLLEKKDSSLGLALQEIGIDFPTDTISPKDRENVVKPREWLVRGHGFKDIFIDPKFNYTFQWHEGELTRGGVFFGDNIKPLMLNQGVYPVYKTDTIGGDWIIRDSKEFEAIVKDVAEEKGWSVATISGYHQAAAEVQKRYNTYEIRTGIATIGKPLPIEEAYAILVKPGYFTPQDLTQIPEEIRNKFVSLPRL